MIGDMNIRKATMSDATAICEIVNYHAERGRMLHISLESTYERLRNFLVADQDGQVIGCAAVEIAWADLAELRSVAVSPLFAGQGVGKALVQAAIRDAAAMGVRRLFALTYESGFFAHCGFHVIDRQELPTKVWRVCIACPRRTACDETAMMQMIAGGRQTQAKTPAPTKMRGRRTRPAPNCPTNVCAEEDQKSGGEMIDTPQNPAPGAIIELKGLYKNFNGLKVLRGVNLAVQHGSTTVIIGPSGCGKSVLLKHIVGLLRPTAGQVVFEGQVISSMSEMELVPMRRRMGYVFQGGALFRLDERARQCVLSADRARRSVPGPALRALQPGPAPGGPGRSAKKDARGTLRRAEKTRGPGQGHRASARCNFV